MIATSPLVTSELDGKAQSDAFRADVLRGLCARQKWLPCKYFYDDAGARLFEQITELSEYYLTRTELAIMQHHAAEMASQLGNHCLLIEYGSGSGVKTRLLLRHLHEPAGYVPIDLAREQLWQTADSLALDYPALKIQPLCADFTTPLELPPSRRGHRRVVYFPGSTLGNFTPAESVTLLRQTADLCGRRGGMLLGVDLRKDPRIIEQAYNDSQLITAAFNRNLLTRINRELGGNFQVDHFWHHALYNPVEGRIEMHLVSQRDQGVSIGSEEMALAEGESIRTEFSYKYTLRGLRELAGAAGFTIEHCWTDANRYFAVLYLVAS